MATLDWPEDLCPAKSTWGLQSNTEAFTSPLNRSTQTLERPGARWKATLEFPPMAPEKRRKMEAFLASLNGMAGRFRLWPHGRGAGAPYAPLVDGNLGDYKMLPVKGLPASTMVLRAGEFIEAGGELKMVTADVMTNPSGQAWIFVAPAFRKAPANNSPVILDKPKAVMMLQADEYGVAVVPGLFAEQVVVSAVEVFQ